MRRQIKTIIKTLVSTIVCLFIITASSECQVELDDWQIKNPNDIGLDQELLKQLESDLIGDVFGNTHEVIIIKEGYLVFEHYGEGHNIDDLHYTASVSKSVGSMVFGLAMDKGHLPELSTGILQQPISMFLPDHQSLFKKEKSKILLNHVLNMTANLEWDEESFPYSDPRNDWHMASVDDDPVKYAFSKDLIGKPGEVFEYNGGMPITLSYLVKHSMDQKTISFAKEKLFNPLGIKEFRWDHLRCGLLDFDGGLHLRPRDMARIGQLMLNKGKWNGKQILSKEWVEVSSQMHIKNEGSPDYGYQWWGGQYSFYENSCEVFMASGHGGQLIVIIPEFEMVVVITQQVFDNPMGQINTIGLLAKYILPATQEISEPIEETNKFDKVQRLGTYSWNQAILNIKMENNSLIAVGGDGSEITLEPLGENRFIGMAINIIPVYFEFKGDKLITRFAFQNQSYIKNE